MNLDALRSYSFPEVRHAYTTNDSILYALSLGCGSNPMDREQLQFVYESGQKVVPSQCVVLGYAGPWMARPEFGINFAKVLHGEQQYEIHRPLPPSGVVVAHQMIKAVVDKGKDKGAAVYVRKTIRDEDGMHLATTHQTLMMLGDGGCGGFGRPPDAAHVAGPLTGTPIHHVVATLPQQALMYRLTGDMNPLHADPVVAARAGYPRPILMGLCGMGMATLSAINALCDGHPERIRGMPMRFAQPIFPGETLRITFFDNSTTSVAFTVESLERGIAVMERCIVTIS